LTSRASRFVILASDRNWDYVFSLPLTCLFWEAFAGFRPVVFLVGTREEWMDVGHCRVALERLERWTNPPVHHLKSQETLEDCNLAQASRLFAAALPTKGYLYFLTADMDMWPLSATYWNRDGGKAVHVHSANAYGRHQFPLSYVGANVETWRAIIGIEAGEDIAARVARIYGEEWGNLKGERNRAWDYDERWFTRRLLAWQGYPEQCLFIDRPGSRHGLMSGRVDRANWVWNGPREGGLIDAHLLRPGWGAHWPRLLELVRGVLPSWATEAQGYRDSYVAILEAKG
jgi:hypothetical protein